MQFILPVKTRNFILHNAAIAQTGASSIKDMGKVMGVVKGQAAGRADMGAVGARIKAKLGAAG